MRERSFGWSGLALALAASSPADARADAKQACSAAYEQTQALRDGGKLRDARKAAMACSAAACSSYVVKECLQWLAEIDANLPTVVFEVRDPSSKDTGAVRISLDGQPWIDGLDGTARAIDPGPHTLRFVLPGGEAREERVLIRQGEKNRKLVVSFQKAAPPAPEVVAPALPRPEPPPLLAPAADRPSVAPWVVGGVGVAGLVVGGVLGGIVLHDKSVSSDPAQCSAALMKCTTTGASAEGQGRALGPATTAALIVGGVGVAGAVVWLLVRRPASAGPRARVALGVRAGPGGAVGHMEAAW